jgi:hypothetical protein
LSGASAQLLLVWVLTKGPAYITFPTCLNLVGILVALAANLLMDFDEEHNAASPRIRTSG